MARQAFFNGQRLAMQPAGGHLGAENRKGNAARAQARIDPGRFKGGGGRFKRFGRLFTTIQIKRTHAAELAQWRDTGECAEAGIERSDAVGARMRDACEDAARAAAEESILVVVSHGSAIIRGILTLLGLNPLSFDGLRGLDNCHWSEVVRMGGGGCAEMEERRVGKECRSRWSPYH